MGDSKIPAVRDRLGACINWKYTPELFLFSIATVAIKSAIPEAITAATAALTAKNALKTGIAHLATATLTL